MHLSLGYDRTGRNFRLTGRSPIPHSPFPIPHSLQIIQDCYAIYRRIEEELNLTHVAAHVGTEGNELADRMAMLGAQRKEEEPRRFPS